MAVLLGDGRVLERIAALTTSVDVLRQRLEAQALASTNADVSVIGRLEAVERAVERVAARQEEILGYLAARINRLVAAQATYLGDHVALTFLESGHRIYVDTRDAGIASHLLTLGLWDVRDLALFRRLLRPGARVLDIGANHGVYALNAAEAVGPSGEVHAYEANPVLAGLMTTSAEVNGYSNLIRVHNVAVGEAEGSATFMLDHAMSGGAAVRANRSAGTGTICRVVALDEHLPPGIVVDAIKMDVEGAEGPALRGMRHLLERSPDVRLLMEFAPEMLADAGVPAAEVTAMLAGMGFRAWTIGPDAGLAPVGWDSLAALTGGDRNIVVSRSDPT